MSTISRRSPRLMEKEATANIAALFEAAKIPTQWIFDDALFQKRWEYEQLLAANERVAGYRCHCSDCSYEQAEELKKHEDYLPFNNFTKEEVVPVMKALMETFAICKHKEQRIMYGVALMRFIHGPARVLLKNAGFRAVTQLQCSELPQQTIDIGLIYTPFGERLADACWAVAEIITEYNNEDGYDIFHTY